MTLSVCELKFPSEVLVCQTSDRLLIREQQLNEPLLLIVEVDCEGEKFSSVISPIGTMQSDNCVGHEQRQERRNKIKKLLRSSLQTLDETTRVLIKKGPVSVETSLKELEENYASKPEHICSLGYLVTNLVMNLVIP